MQQQKEVKSRQEASTQNRLKAKEFHKVIYWSQIFFSHVDLIFFFFFSRKLYRSFVPSRHSAESHFLVKLFCRVFNNKAFYLSLFCSFRML